MITVKTFVMNHCYLTVNTWELTPWELKRKRPISDLFEFDQTNLVNLQLASQKKMYSCGTNARVKFPAGYLKRPSCLLGRVAIQNTCGIRFIQEPNWFTSPACRFRQSSFERFRLNHVYGKRQTSVSSWEFLKIGNEQIETVQNSSLMDKNGVKLLIFE